MAYRPSQLHVFKLQIPVVWKTSEYSRNTQPFTCPHETLEGKLMELPVVFERIRGIALRRVNTS